MDVDIVLSTQCQQRCKRVSRQWLSRRLEPGLPLRRRRLTWFSVSRACFVTSAMAQQTGGEIPACNASLGSSDAKPGRLFGKGMVDRKYEPMPIVRRHADTPQRHIRMSCGRVAQISWPSTDGNATLRKVRASNGHRDRVAALAPTPATMPAWSVPPVDEQTDLLSRGR
jgi:hypothetical protein